MRDLLLLDHKIMHNMEEQQWDSAAELALLDLCFVLQQSRHLQAWDIIRDVRVPNTLRLPMPMLQCSRSPVLTKKIIALDRYEDRGVFADLEMNLTALPHATASFHEECSSA